MKLLTTICLIAILGPEKGKIFGIILLLSMEKSMMQQHQDPSQLIQLSSILNLIYDCDASSKIAVKTPVGLTDRKEVKKIVAQGEPPFSLKCTVTVDSISQTHTENLSDHLYLYRGIVPVPPLGTLAPKPIQFRTKFSFNFAPNSVSKIIQFRTKFSFNSAPNFIQFRTKFQE